MGKESVSDLGQIKTQRKGRTDARTPQLLGRRRQNIANAVTRWKTRLRRSRVFRLDVPDMGLFQHPDRLQVARKSRAPSSMSACISSVVGGFTMARN